MIDYKHEYVKKFLEAKNILVSDIVNATHAKQSTIYYLKHNINKVDSANNKLIDDLYLYFKSLNLDENKLDKVTRVTTVTYKQP